MDWNDLNLVLAICRAGTLSGAARALGVNHSTVFRRLNAIEKSIKVRLFDRRPSGYVMTEAGEAVQRAAERITREVDALSRELLGRDLRLEGLIRVTSPEGIALKFVNARLAEFCAEHPQVHVDLVVTSSALRLSRREADIAIRVTRKPPANYIGSRIGKFRFGLYASREYVASNPDARLEDHRWLLSDDGFDLLPTAVWKNKDHTPHIVFSSNNAMTVIDAAKRGRGVAPLPCFLGEGEPGLVRLGDPLEPLTMELWVLTHPDLRHTARVRALMTALVSTLSKQKSRFAGRRS